DYRGRLWELKLSSKGIKATIQCPLGSRPEDLIGKVYAAYQPEHIADYGTVEIEDGVIQFPTKDFPSRVIVAILDRRTGELVDRKDTHMGGVHGLSIESAPEDVENLALAGESDVLEYKEKMPSGQDLAKEVVAFTNSKGGTILIGVTDEGE